MTRKNFDIIIIGGSIAGLSAALTLARSLQNVAVFDANNPCNHSVSKAFNFSTNDGRNPSEILESCKIEISNYQTVQIFQNEVISVKKRGNHFEVETNLHETFCANRILIATGLTDILPKIPGFKECWGKTVLHCPYCHGYEARNQKTAVYANGQAAHDLSILLTNWTSELTVVTDGKSELSESQTKELQLRNIQIIQDKITSLSHKDGNLSRINFENGAFLEVPYMYASVPFEQKSKIAKKLQLKLTDSGHIDIDSVFRTSMKNVYAAGDCVAQQRALSVAAASGTTAGFTINQDSTDGQHQEFIKK